MAKTRPMVKTETKPIEAPMTLAGLREQSEKDEKEKRSALMSTYRSLLVKDILRRPRTDGFLAGRFYAATAGAFSASYASGER
jgi:hypothetical protein